MKKFTLLVVVFMLVVGLLPQMAIGADRSMDRFLVDDQNSNFGIGASEAIEGGPLGWSQSYILESYMNMYEASQNNEWLDKIVEQTNTIIGNSDDHDGDGYKGWPDLLYAHKQLKNRDFAVADAPSGATQLVQNTSFEVDLDANNVPDGWTQQGNSAKTYRSTTAGDAHDGSAGVIVESDSVNANRLVQNLSYIPGKTYVVEGFMGLDNEKTQARIEVFNTTTETIIALERSHHIGFERYSFNFTAPASGDLQLRLGLQNYQYSGYKARFDLITVKLIDDAPSEIALNGGFETVNGSDSTLPAEWTRWHASSSSNVYLTTNAANVHSGTQALAVTTDNTSWEVAYQEFSYTPSTNYTVRFWGRNSSTAAVGRVAIYNVTDDETVAYKLLGEGTAWNPYTLEFTAPAAAGKELIIRLYQSIYSQVGFTTYFDDISILPSAALVKNSGFEMTDGSDSTLPANWSRWQASDSSNIYLTTDPANVRSGTQALAVTTDNTSYEVAYQNISYIPSTSYTVHFWGRNSSTATSGRVAVYNVTDGVTLASKLFAGTAWSSNSFEFTAPATAGKELIVRLYQYQYSQVGFTSYYDDISILPSAVPQVVSNSTFETASGGDSTLPNDWTRDVSSGSGNVYISTGINNYYSGNHGLAIEASAGSSRSLEQLISYVPGQKYEVRFFGRAANKDSGVRAEVINVTDQVSLGFHDIASTTWTNVLFGFTAPAVSGKTVIVRLSASEQVNNFTAYFDDVTIKPVLHTDAAGWERINTSMDYAHRTNAAAAGASGNWVMELVQNGTTDPKVSQRLLNYEPGTRYSFMVTAKVTPGATGTFRAVNATTDTTLASGTITNSDTFGRHYVYFDSPEAAGQDLRMEITLNGGSTNDKMFVNDAIAGQVWEQMVHEAMIMNPVLRFINTVYADPSLQGTYLTAANTFRNFIADHLFHKWDPYWKQITGTDGSNNGTGVYIFPSGFSTEWFPGRSLPHNQYLAYARMLYQLYDATNGASAYEDDRSLYLSRASDMSRAFKSVVVAHPKNTELTTNAYKWGYWTIMGDWDLGHYKSSYTSEDISHAALTMTGPYEAYKHGQVFNMTDMQKFTRTFTDVMWNQSMTDPMLNYDIAHRPVTTSDQLSKFSFHFWSNYAQFDQTVTDITESICKLESCPQLIASNMAKWSRNKAVNPGFENQDPTDATLPVFWTRWQSNSSTAYLDDSDPALGSWSTAVKTNGSTWQGLRQELENYEPNTPYTVSFMGKTDGSLSARVQLYDLTTSTNLGQYVFSDTDWTQHSFTATTPEEGHEVVIRLFHANYTPANAGAWYDEVHAFPHLHGSHIPNGSFEVIDPLTSANLPRFWEAGETTNISNIEMDTSNRTSGLQSLKLTTAANDNPQELYYLWKGYRPDELYEFTVTAKTNGSAAGGRVKVIDTSDNDAVLVNISITSTAWATSTVNFTAPEDYDHVLKVIITHNDPQVNDGILWVDDIAASL